MVNAPCFHYNEKSIKQDGIKVISCCNYYQNYFAFTKDDNKGALLGKGPSLENCSITNKLIWVRLGLFFSPCDGFHLSMKNTPVKTQLEDDKYFRVRVLKCLQRLNEPLPTRSRAQWTNTLPAQLQSPLPSLLMILCNFCVSHGNCIPKEKILKIHKICF